VFVAMDRGWLAERLEAGTSYEEIARELGCSPSKVSYWASKHGLSSAHTRRHATRGAIDELLLRHLVAGRFSIREIAETLDRSATTVRHWLAKLDLETTPIRHSPAAERAAARGDAGPTLYCAVHGITRHVRRDTGYRCALCRVEGVTDRRRRVKRILLEEAGGACALCGYARCTAALHFHHLDPASKGFAIGVAGVTRSLAAARAEARKCVVLCANCHAEVESGLADVPVRSNEPVVPGSAVDGPG
jgi:transposase-like protein